MAVKVYPFNSAEAFLPVLTDFNHIWKNKEWESSATPNITTN